MKFTKLAIGAMLMVSAAVASAADYNHTYTLDLTSGGLGLTGNFGAAFGSGTGKTFLDTYTFSVNTPSDLSGFVGSFYLNSPKAPSVVQQGLNITSFDLYSGNTKIASGVNQSGPSFSWESLTTNASLTSGSYSLQVGGKIVGNLGGSYGGNVNVVPVVAPVPEPETWGMMATGMAALGFLARRRGAKKSTAA